MSPVIRPARSTPNLGIPIPGDADPADFVTYTGALADRVDAQAATTANLAALASRVTQLESRPVGATYVTSLPASPTDGQEVFYAANAAQGVIWHLRYRSGASGSYRWEVLGGAPLVDQRIGTFGGPTSPTIGSITGGGAVAISVPRPGNYLARFVATAWVQYLNVLLRVGGTVYDGLSGRPGSGGIYLGGAGGLGGGGDDNMSLAGQEQFTVASAGTTVDLAVSIVATYTLTIFLVGLAVEPLRLG